MSIALQWDSNAADSRRRSLRSRVRDEGCIGLRG
jgi:hypothetical protein